MSYGGPGRPPGNEITTKAPREWFVIEGMDIYLSCPAELLKCSEAARKELADVIGCLASDEYAHAGIETGYGPDRDLLVGGGRGRFGRHTLWIHPEINRKALERYSSAILGLASGHDMAACEPGLEINVVESGATFDLGYTTYGALVENRSQLTAQAVRIRVLLHGPSGTWVAATETIRRIDPGQRAAVADWVSHAGSYSGLTVEVAVTFWDDPPPEPGFAAECETIEVARGVSGNVDPLRPVWPGTLCAYRTTGRVRSRYPVQTRDVRLVVIYRRHDGKIAAGSTDGDHHQLGPNELTSWECRVTAPCTIAKSEAWVQTGGVVLGWE